MTDRPTLDYRQPEPAAAPRAIDYVVATVGALLVFVGIAGLLSVAVMMFAPQLNGTADALAGIGMFVLAIGGATSSFFSSLRRSRAARGRKA